MAIEFPCPDCGQLVRTSDAAAGKKGVCPECRAIVSVPLSSTAAANQADQGSSAGVIECPCPACGQVVRAPAAAAGKRGKCPECQALLTIPARSTVSAAAAAVVPTRAPVDRRDPWIDLPLPGGHAAAPVSAAADLGEEQQPFAEETQPAWIAIMERARSDLDSRGGLAWDRDATLGNMFDTTFQLCTGGGQGFDDMAIQGGYSTPLTFYIFSLLVYQVAVVLFYTGGFVLLMLVGDAQISIDWMALAHAACFLAVMGAINAAVGGTISAFVSAWCIHVPLMLLGRLRYGYEATFRVLCYSGGACHVLSATIVFAPIVVVFAFLLPIRGLARVHRIPVWHAALAFLLGIILTVVALGGLFVLVFMLVIKALIVTFQLQDYFGRWG